MSPTPHTRAQLEDELLGEFNHAGGVRVGDNIHIQMCDDTGFGPGVILKPDGTYEIEYIFTIVEQTS